MINADEFYCGMSESEFRGVTQNHFDQLKTLSSTASEDEQAIQLLREYGDRIFNSNLIGNKHSKLLCDAILRWYDNYAE